MIFIYYGNSNYFEHICKQAETKTVFVRRSLAIWG